MSYFDYAHLPIGDLDTAVQSALIADDPQRAVTHLVKRYAEQMAGGGCEQRSSMSFAGQEALRWSMSIWRRT